MTSCEELFFETVYYTLATARVSVTTPGEVDFFVLISSVVCASWGLLGVGVAGVTRLCRSKGYVRFSCEKEGDGGASGGKTLVG